MTPLKLCCLRVDEEAARVAALLLDHGANLEVVGGEWDRTPLLDACRSGRPDVVSLLLERGASVKVVTRMDSQLFILLVTTKHLVRR